MISLVDAPLSPIPPGFMEAAAAQGLYISREPAGWLVSDFAGVVAFAASYVGSAAELAWHKSNQQQNGLLDQLSALYAAKMAAGCVYNGKSYQIDPASLTNIAGMAARAGLAVAGVPGVTWTDGFAWIALDNTQTAMAATDMLAFSQSVATYVSGLVISNRTIKDAIAAATNMANLQAIDINSGWPANQ
jgi:hypothetical protein